MKHQKTARKTVGRVITSRALAAHAFTARELTVSALVRQALVRPALAIATLTLAVLSGCRGETKYQDSDFLYYRNQPDSLIEAYAEAESDPERDGLLGKMKLLSSYLLLKDWDSAEALAIKVSAEVNIYIAGLKGERDALSTFGSEREKPFKGEPHEQVMAEFYLGMLRYRNDDFEGALSCFRSALNKDRGYFMLPVPEERAKKNSDNVETFLYESDYATIEVLAAKCWKKLGQDRDAARSLEKAKKLRPKHAKLFDAVMDDENNVLILLETGRAPNKRGSGPRRSVLSYDRIPTVAVQSVTLDGIQLAHGTTDDLFMQATTLGGRNVDELNLTKAKRQEALQAIGHAAVLAGTIIMIAGHNDSNAQKAGFITLIVGILTILFAEAAIDAEADTRAWSLLPGRLGLAVGKTEPGEDHALEISTVDLTGENVRRWENITLGAEGNVLMLRLFSLVAPPKRAQPARPDQGRSSQPNRRTRTRVRRW